MQMTRPQTALALNRRALTAAACLEIWRNELFDEMEKQGIKPGSHPGDDETITLNLRFVRRLALEMADQEKELKRFAKHQGRV
jgi:hypothetical protein